MSNGDDISIEWGRQGHHSAARNRITTAEAYTVTQDWTTTVRVDTPVGRWHVGLSEHSGIITVITERVRHTNIHEITVARPASDSEAALYHRSNP